AGAVYRWVVLHKTGVGPVTAKFSRLRVICSVAGRLYCVFAFALTLIETDDAEAGGTTLIEEVLTKVPVCPVVVCQPEGNVHSKSSVITESLSIPLFKVLMYGFNEIVV
ncbi:MAG TPA: hypothetical protein DD653_01060, partial [Marinilabiliales bacterium]|nr:hypothetical protein [Marinilabiliales bacterium]